tara:strand:- start:29 stop:838 length:810 start_codon:yes stop_codon:yes gene_type:complete
MLPWIKNYLTKEFIPRPKTIFFGPEGLDVIDLSRLLITKFISEIDGKNYSNNALEDIASPNFYFLKREEDKSNIPIEQLRKPKNFLSLSTANKKILFIQNGEHIRLDGYNTLLKVSEEVDEKTFIFIATNNINSIPPTIISRFHKHRFPMPKREEVRAFLNDIKLDLSEVIKDFISFNPWLIEQGEDHELLSKIKNFDSYIKTKNIKTKDKIEIEAFIDYLVFVNKNNTRSSPKNCLKNLEKLIDIKKSIRSPNNLSLDIIKLRINSCV